MDYYPALNIAQRLVDLLAPACKRIEIAGSLRRMKSEVKDIEIVAIPDLRPPRPVFGQQLTNSIFNACLNSLMKDECDGIRLYMDRGADKYKKFAVSTDGGHTAAIYLDLFLVTPPASWGVIYTLRTGPADFSHWLVSPRFIGGGFPAGYYLRDGAVWKNDSNDYIPMPEEIDFLNFCKLNFIEPKNRQPMWVQRTRKIQVHQSI
jgi:DNA polymerase/3'-5' exonuclease PolX